MPLIQLSNRQVKNKPSRFGLVGKNSHRCLMVQDLFTRIGFTCDVSLLSIFKAVSEFFFLVKTLYSLTGSSMVIKKQQQKKKTLSHCFYVPLKTNSNGDCSTIK